MKKHDYTILGELIKPKVRGKETKCWYICYRLDDDPKRTIHKCPLFTDKAKSRNRITKEVEKHIEKRLAKLQPQAVNPNAAKTLEEHLADYLPVLRRETTSKRYAINVAGYIRRPAAALGWQRIEDIKAGPLRKWLAEQTCADATRRRYWAGISAFCSWLADDEDGLPRLDSHPLLGRSRRRKQRAKREERKTFSRRALDQQELARLVTTAAASKETVFGLSGRDRAMLYLFVSSTGLRAHEASSVTPASFDWKKPEVVIDCTISKRRRTDEIQLPTAAMTQLRDWVGQHEAGAPLWPGRWWCRAAEMLRVDLEAAGIKHDDKAARVDFHSLRTTHITNVVGSGAPMALVMRICRLSTASLLDNYYKPADATKTAAIEAVAVPTIE